MSDLSSLYSHLGYQFNDTSLIEAALTHRSSGSLNNERLEFLGDALLNFIIAEKLFILYPKSSEGELSRLRASLVKGDTLAELAKELMLHKYLRLGSGEIKSGGALRSSILANALEAVLGAVYLDGGMTVCQERVLSWFESRITAISAVGVQKDSKTILQEYMQAKHFELPKYRIVNVEGEAHTQVFHVECQVENYQFITQGIGTSRRRAEQDAAAKFLAKLAVI